MNKIIYSINSTVNGRCSHTDAIADAEHVDYASNLLASTAAMLFGRTTFDLFEAYWPKVAASTELPEYVVALGKQLGAAKKYVVSRRKLASHWPNTILLSGPVESEIANLRQKIRGNILVFGSPRLASYLAAAYQINEYHVLLQPFIANSGPRLLDSVVMRQELELLSATQFRSGVLLLKYRPHALL